MTDQNILFILLFFVFVFLIWGRWRYDLEYKNEEEQDEEYVLVCHVPAFINSCLRNYIVTAERVIFLHSVFV